MPTKLPSSTYIAENAKLTGSIFRDVCLGNAKFDDVNLGGAMFQNVNLSDARFDDVNFSGVEISNAHLARMKINGILVSDLLAAYRNVE